jgi:general secretion pathway protein G
MRSNNSQAGFTLIEIMVVVMVIALMGAIIGPTVFKQLDKAKVTRIAQDIRVIEGALKFYKMDNYRYPTQAQGLEALVTQPVGEEKWAGPYLPALPVDPRGDSAYRYTNPSAQGKDVDVFTLGFDNQTGGEGPDKDWGNWNIK